MKDQEVFYRTILDHVRDGVYSVDRSRTITYWNRGAERITGYSAAEATGKTCSDNFLMHSDMDGRVLCLCDCPLSDAMSEGRGRSSEIYLRHKNGHRVPVSVVVWPMRDDSGAIIGCVEVFAEKTPISAAYERLAELEKMAYLDSLTSLANRRYAEISLVSRLEELQRYGWQFGVLFIDIDNFKNVNDEYGHTIGDAVLRTVAKTLQNSVRSFDLVSRWGGEEYVAVIANIDHEELVATANRCRALVEQSGMPSAPGLRVTVSIGATLALRGDTVESIVHRADELMYQSKKAGRNCVSGDGVCAIGRK